MTLRAAALIALGLAGLAHAEGLDRPETPVVVTGERLAALHAYTADQLRVYALDPDSGALVAIPFQVDERTPDGGYAYDQGSERRSDTDDGQLDENDELVFMARHAGPRAVPAQLTLGQLAQVELGLRDPLDDGQGWVYVLAFREPPPASADDAVTLDLRDGAPIGWTSRRARLRSSQPGNLLAFDELRFRDAQGELGPDVLDRAKLRFEARYLFTDLVRRFDEVRCGVLAWRDGPVRAVVGLVPECYLIWGHWLRPAGPEACRLVVYDGRAELELRLRLPVDLEPDAPSSLRLSWDFLPVDGDDGTRVWTDRNPRRWRGGSSRRSRLQELDRRFPDWICATPPGGSLLARVELGAALARAGNALYLEDGAAPDPPEDVPGSFANVGFQLSLTGLDAAEYRLRLTLQLGPTLEPGGEALLLKPDTPLELQVGE